MFKNLHLILLILLNSMLLNANSYDDDILNIYSKLSPRFILMSSQKEKIKDDINICILHDELDERVAKTLIRKTNDNYQNGIKNYSIKLTALNYSNINTCQDSQLMFLFNSSVKNLKQAVEFSRKNKILTIAYDEKLLQSGVDISLFLGRKITPYLHIDSINNKDIMLDNVLIRISKIYSKESKQ